MKTPFFLCLTLAVCRLYAQDTSLFRHLPPDAGSIYQFNLPVLTAKLSWEELAQRIPLPQQNTNNRELAAILREPGRAGIDLHRPIFLTETESCTGTGGHNNKSSDTLHTISLLVHLADSARWAAFLREQDPGIRLSIDKGNACCARRERMGAAWDSTLAVITFTPSAPNYSATAVRRCLAMLRGYPAEQLISDALFRSGFTDDADVLVWTKHGHLLFLLLQQLLHLDHTPSLPLVSDLKLRTLTTLRFEKGRITIKSRTALPPGLDSLYTRFTGRQLPAPLLAPVPAGSVLGMFNFHFEPAAIAGLLDGFQARGRTEALLFDKGLSVETFVHGFNGDLLMMAIQPPALPVPPAQPAPTAADTMAVRVGHVPESMPRPSLYLAATLRDETAFWSWSNRLKWFVPSTDPSAAGRTGARNPLSKYLPTYHIRDSLLVMSTGPQKLSAWWEASRSRPGTYASLTIRAPAPESPLTLWLDLKAITASLQQRTPEKNRALLSILKAFDQFSFTAGRLNASGQLENTLELTMADTTANSLRILFDLLQ